MSTFSKSLPYIHHYLTNSLQLNILVILYKSHETTTITFDLRIAREFGLEVDAGPTRKWFEEVGGHFWPC